ncbi:MAG: hypothetical protein HC880_13115 [Bacteroidia bacterium]|nr:hypothetical protein [Bacteroidia bacterium]
MKKFIPFTALLFCIFSTLSQAQDTLRSRADSLEVRNQQIADSVRAYQDSVKAARQAVADSIQREADRLQAQADSVNKANRLYLDSLLAQAYPVVLKDTLLYIYSGIGKLSIEERAKSIERKLQSLVNSDDFHADSLFIRPDEGYWSVMHKEQILLSVTPEDSAARGLSRERMARDYLQILRETSLSSDNTKPLWNGFGKLGLP